jgi:hypothetical protein
MDKQKQVEEMAKIIKPIVVSSYLVDRGNDEVKKKAIEEVKKQQTRNATALYNAGYRKESDTAKECLEQFICRLVNARLVGVNDDLYYELLEAKDDLLKEKYGVDLGE